MKILIPLFFLSFTTHAAYKREPESCFPLSDQKYIAGSKSFSGLDLGEYNQIINSVESVMAPEVKKQLGKKLIFERNWEDPTVDAFATRDDDNNAVIVVNGGLARHSLMTKDAFLLLLCHEVGHHLGGAPKIIRGTSGLRSWSSAEGQADYYATSKCLPLFFKTGIDLKIFNTELDPNSYKTALSKCRDNSCARIALAGQDASRVFASLVSGTPEPKLTAKDKTAVSKTLFNHPNPQCRLDTYVAGANCDLGAEVPFDNKDPKVGACTQDNGVRPGCWFSKDAF